MSRKSKSILINAIVLLLVFGIYKIYPTVKHGTLPRINGIPTNSLSGTTAPEQPASCHMIGQLPDTVCTPGVKNVNVTQATINQTICVSGYTKTIRPPASYTDTLKSQQMQQYGFTDSIHMHEEDHLISLELGGSPTDPKNLWPEPHASPNPKDKIENFLHAAVCAGRVSLADAQSRITTNWVNAEQGL
jgi:hypothetical protein